MTNRAERLERPVEDPWFRLHPGLAVAVATALFLGVLALRLLVGDPVDAYSMLYVFPVALLAVVFGVRGGVLAGLAGVALMVVWAIARDVSLTPTGWLSRALPILLLGALLGQASDRIRRADGERRALAKAALLHRQAIEINDSLIQGMAAAKWSLEAGNLESGLRTLDEAIAEAQDLVSGLIREAGMDKRAERVDGR